MNKNKKLWNLGSALAYYDDQIDENHLSRIFIEPPDETNTSCEESDDEVPATISNVNCEVVLRSGRRYKCNNFNDSQNELESKQLKKTSDIEGKNKSKSQVKVRVQSKSMIAKCKSMKTNPKCDQSGTQEAQPKCGEFGMQENQPKRKQVTKRKLNRKEIILTKSVVNGQKHDTIHSGSVDEPENRKEAETSKKKMSTSTKSTNDYVWIDDASKPMIPIFPSPNYTDCSGKTAVEQYEKFFDDVLFALIVKESSKYADYLGKPDPNISIEELKVYIGILVVSGYSVQSRLESYWSSDPDLRNELVCQSMRKNRFKEISQFLHFKDMNEPNSADKIWKLRPLTDHLKKKMLSNFHPEQNLAYDESMIEYYGRHGMKQCMKPKPIPFGFKVWSLCTTAGYLVNFEIYQGKNPRSKTEYEERFGKSIAPLFCMIEDFDDDVRALPYSFYFDNLFTGIPALTHLKSLGYNGTGTIRENRLPKGCPLKEKKKETVKRGRGYMASKSIKGLDVHVTQWVDNSVVRVASTVFGMKPVAPALRYSSVEKKKVEVPRPLVVSKYNKSMGGVDRMDENVSLYRINIHGKKWWSCIFTWMIDVSIQNAWQLHRVQHPEMPQLDFRREIALYYCRHYGVPPKSTGNRKRKMEEKDYSSLRYDNLRHWPRQIAKRRRCALETCQSSIRTMCVKCNVGLCVNCFEPYHSLEKFKQ